MALETATYINQLVQTNPLGSDPLADADGHLRLIKSTLKATFPNITGPVTATQGTLNSPFPVGGSIMWSGAVGSIPSGWLLCDGNNGTPNLRDRFVIGAGSSFAVGATGGSATISAANLPAHTHSFSGTTGTMNQNWSHSHSVSDPGHSHGWNYQPMFGTSPGGGSFAVGSGATQTVSVQGTNVSINATDINHTHSFSGTTSSVGNGTAYYPPYYALAFIMKAAY